MVFPTFAAYDATLDEVYNGDEAAHCEGVYRVCDGNITGCDGNITTRQLPQ